MTRVVWTWSNFDLSREASPEQRKRHPFSFQQMQPFFRFLFPTGPHSKCSLKQISNCLSSLTIWIKKMTKFLVLPLDTSGQNRSTNGEKSWWQSKVQIAQHLFTVHPDLEYIAPSIEKVIKTLNNKILGGKLFRTREFPRSGSKAKDRGKKEEEKRRKTERWY